uniref:Catsper channel auxiliary subunit epsilon n=1 Tax=Monodelphis domestica TaxID=13616 RepID=A0A5F8GPJ6_MONDO
MTLAFFPQGFHGCFKFCPTGFFLTKFPHVTKHSWRMHKQATTRVGDTTFAPLFASKKEIECELPCLAELPTPTPTPTQTQQKAKAGARLYKVLSPWPDGWTQSLDFWCWRKRSCRDCVSLLVMFCGKVLVALVLLLNQCFALWRYKTNSMPYSIFSTRTTIHLEYTGTGFTEWETPAVCSVGNKTSKTTVMNCANQGTHRIRPLVANQDPELEERFLFVERSSDCFLWYLQSNSVEGDDSQTVTLYQDVKYENVENYYQLQEENTGHMMIQLRPSQFSKICPLSSQAVHVFVGCFPQRHIVVKEYDYDECKKENITYTIEKEFLRGNATENKNVSFDTQKNGCPLRISMRSSFHPTLLLYDADVFVEEVTTNFIVREIHGRMDFTFNLTMKESGCVNEAQTWDSMLEKNKYLPIEEVWGPQNYKDCFTYSVGKPGDLSKPYEILNMSNKNFIIFNNPHLGMYVFEIKILDPNYSFCNLKAIFAIETFGETPKTDTLLVVLFLGILIFVFFACLIGSYFQYLKIFRKFIYEPHLGAKREY